MHKRNAVVTAGVRLFHALTTDKETHTKQAHQREEERKRKRAAGEPEDMQQLICELAMICEHMHAKHYDYQGKVYIPMQSMRVGWRRRMIMNALQACSPWILREDTVPKEASDIFLRLTSRQAMLRWFDVVVRGKRMDAEDERKRVAC